MDGWPKVMEGRSPEMVFFCMHACLWRGDVCAMRVCVCVYGVRVSVNKDHRGHPHGKPKMGNKNDCLFMLGRCSIGNSFSLSAYQTRMGGL